MDGWVTIGTKLDTKQLDKDLKNAEKQLQQYEKEAEKLATQKMDIEAKIKINEAEYKSKIDKLNQKYKAEIQANTVFGQVRGQDKIDTKYDQLRYQLDIAYGKSVEQNNYRLEKINQKIKENTKNQGVLNGQISEMGQKLQQAKKVNSLKDFFSETSNSLSDVIKKVGKWALAIFGVRSAYNLVRNAISTLSQYNSQLATDIEYVRYALASALEPVIRRIIKLVQTLLTYINYIAKAWFGKEIFASAKAFEDAKKSSSGIASDTGKAAKNVKELNKQLAGFDEMNILQDNTSDTSSGAGGVGGGDISAPSFDLGNWDDIEVPSWIKWIADNKDIVIAGLLGIAGAIVAMKLSNLAKSLGLVKEGISGIQALGIGVMIAGIVYAIQGLIEYLKDPSWNNFGKIIQGIGVFVTGLGIAFLGLPGIIAGVIIIIVGTIIKYWEEIKAFLIKGIEWLENSIDDIRSVFGDQIANIYETFITMFKGIIIGFDNVFSGLKTILDGIIQFVKGVFTGNWKQAWEGIKTIFSGIFTTMKGLAQSVISFIGGLVVSIAQTVGYTIGDMFKAVVNGVLTAIESILNSPIKAVNDLITIINAIPGIKLKPLSTFKLPRLAKGGIVNMPGKGVPVGSAIAGERGQEGVIPLTDSQQMALLGEAIGKYITVNANITTSMNGRVISRELQKVQNDSDFAFNR